MRHASPGFARKAVSIGVPIVACLLAGCGGSEAQQRAGGDGSERAAERSDDAVVAPGPRARRLDRRLNLLISAYAPASARVNFLAAAVILHRDAQQSGAGGAVQAERAGAVTVEARRMLEILMSTRAKVLAQPADDGISRRVQQGMLAALDARIRASRQLEASVAADLDPALGDTERERRAQLWRASWDASLRSAREATTAMQNARARLGLEPAPEESIR